MGKYQINNVELEIDMNDYDFQKKYEEAFQKMGEEEQILQKVGSNAEITKEYCDLFYRLFDRIFGEGTGNALFHGKRNATLTDEVYTEFLSICSEQARAAADRRAEMLSKFRPNRAQRRAKK